MKILLIIISLFLGIFVKPVFAEDKSVVIHTVSPDQDIFVGQTFPVNVVLGTDNLNTSLYYLFYGGPGSEYSYIQTIGESGTVLNLDNYSSNWDLLPTFTTDELGNGYLRANNAFIPDNQPSGVYSLYVRLFLPDYSSPSDFLSTPRLITVLDAVLPISTPTLVIPTSTPVPTTIPTLIPTSTPVPTTSQQQIPTLTPTPTPDLRIFGTIATSSSTLTKIPDDLSLLPTTDPNIDQIEIGSNPVTDNTSVSNSTAIKFFPYIFFITGFILLLVSFLLIKFKKR